MKARRLRDHLRQKKDSPLGRIIVLTGARQTGKTTLARRCFPDYTYLSIEDPVMRLRYKELTAAQWKELYPHAILDEVQKEPSLIESIKSAYDQYEDLRYLLLGSSQLLLLHKVKESLAGRCIIREVWPLTLPEMLTKSWDDAIQDSFFEQTLKHKKVAAYLPAFELYPDFAERQKTFEYYLQFGAYPALVSPALSEEERYEWLSNYIATYLERDVRDLADFRLLDPFIKLQKLTALLTGQLVNFAKLANETDVSAKTAARFLQYLELSYQIITLPPWHKNKTKRLVKKPKLHYLDIGVQRGILQKRGALTGHEWESAVVAELYKQIKSNHIPASCYHLRSHDGFEVDMLVELEEGFFAFECKQTKRIQRKDILHLLRLPDILDKPLLASFVLSQDSEIKEMEKGIYAMPAAMFLTSQTK